MPNKQNQTVRQHYLPQAAYLNRFTSTPELKEKLRIYRYDKLSKDSKELPIKEVAREKNLYAYETHIDKNKKKIRSQLAENVYKDKIEPLLKETIDDIINFVESVSYFKGGITGNCSFSEETLSDELKEKIVTSIAFQFFRTPSIKKSHEANAKKISDAMESWTKAFNLPLAEEAEIMKDHYKKVTSDKEYSTFWFNQTLFNKEIPNLCNALFGFYMWNIIVLDKVQLVTSDIPIIITKRIPELTGGYFGDYSSEIIYPVTPNICIQAKEPTYFEKYKEMNGHVIKLNEEESKVFVQKNNILQLLGSDRFAFSAIDNFSEILNENERTQSNT